MDRLLFDHRNLKQILPMFVVASDVFSDEECQSIIEIGEKSDPEKSLIADGVEKLSVRNSEISFISFSEDKKWIFEKIRIVTEYINENYFQFALDGFDHIQYTKYEKKNSHYDWHIDLRYGHGSWEIRRKLSASVFLSDESEYVGGKFEIGRSLTNESYGKPKQKKGSIVFFPSFIEHRITKIKSGCRRSLVFWVEGPKFK